MELGMQLSVVMSQKLHFVVLQKQYWMNISFTCEKNTNNPIGPRAGKLITNHGTITTPAFMPVGTLASVKALSPEDVLATGARIILVNAYHLYLRPTHNLIEDLGGIHKFMGWPGPIPVSYTHLTLPTILLV